MVLSDGVYRIQNSMSDTYLDYGRPVHMRGWDSSAEANQKWELHHQADGSYKLRAGAKGGWLFASNAGDNVCVAVSTDTEKTWDIESASGDAFTICLHGTKSALDLGMGHKENGTSVNLWTSRGAGQQRWKIIRIGDLSPAKLANPWVTEGRYYIRSLANGTVLEASNIQAIEGTTVVASPQNTRNANQLWDLELGEHQGFIMTNVGMGTSMAGFAPTEGNPVEVRNLGNYGVEWIPSKVGDGLVVGYMFPSTLNLDVRGSAAIFSKPNGSMRTQLWEFISA